MVIVLRNMEVLPKHGTRYFVSQAGSKVSGRTARIQRAIRPYLWEEAMSHPHARFATIFALAIALSFFSAQLQAQQHCGKERWSVKTGTDPDAASVNLASPQNTTIAQLAGLPAPNPIPPSSVSLDGALPNRFSAKPSAVEGRALRRCRADVCRAVQSR
jgi:hypothetical protein